MDRQREAVLSVSKNIHNTEEVNYMKVLKKLTGLILALCLMIPIFGTAVFAADGVLMFSDPSAKPYGNE